MAALMDVENDEEPSDLPDSDLVEKIMSLKWAFSQTYSVGSAENVEDRQPVWLVSFLYDYILNYLLNLKVYYG